MSIKPEYRFENDNWIYDFNFANIDPLETAVAIY